MSLEYLTHQLNAEQIKLVEEYQFNIEKTIKKEGRISSTRAKKAVFEFIDGLNDHYMKDFILSYHDDVVRAYLNSKPRGGAIDGDLFFNYWTDMEFNVGGLPGFEGYLGPKGLRDSGFDTGLPHMDWVHELDKKMKSLKISHPDKDEETMFLYLWRASSLLDDFSVFTEIEKLRVDEGYSAGVSIESFVKMYNRSLENFDGNKLKFDSAVKIGKSLDILKENNQINDLSFKVLCKKHKIHPYHREIVKEWSRNFLDAAEKGREQGLDIH